MWKIFNRKPDGKTKQAPDQAGPRTPQEPGSSHHDQEQETPRENALRKAKFMLIRRMQDIISVLTYIDSNGSRPLPLREYEAIKADPVRSSQVEKLLSLVSARGDEGYDLLRDALKNTEQEDLRDYLPDLPATVTEHNFLGGTGTGHDSQVTDVTDGEIPVHGTGLDAGSGTSETSHDQTGSELANIRGRMEQLQVNVVNSGVIEFTLGNVSRLVVDKDYYSEPKIIGGIPWRLRVRVQRVHDQSRWVWVYLDAYLHNFDQRHYLVKYTTTLARQKRLPGDEDIVYSAGNIYPNPEDGSKSMGPNMIAFDALVKPENGLLITDSMLVTCKVEVKNVKLSKPASGEVTFVFKGVSEMQLDSDYNSDHVTVCGVRWRVLVRAHVLDGEKYLAVYFCGMKDDFDGRQFFVAYKLTLTRQSGNLPDLDDDVGMGIYPDPVDGAVSYGRPFIKFADMTNPDNGWLKDDTIKINCKFIVIELL